MVHMVEKAFNIGLNNVPIFPELKIKAQVVDRIFCTPVWSITVAIIKKVGLEYGCQQLGTSQLHQPVFKGRNAQWSFFAIFFGYVTSTYQFGTITVHFQSLCQSLNVGLQIFLVGLCRHFIYTTGGFLVQVLPTGV